MYECIVGSSNESFLINRKPGRNGICRIETLSVCAELAFAASNKCCIAGFEGWYRSFVERIVGRVISPAQTNCTAKCCAWLAKRCIE